VLLDGKVVALPLEHRYLMLNKPPGVLSSVGDERGRPTVTDTLAGEPRLFPVGRLDLDSRGLLVLTDDGALAMRLMHPRYGVEKEYRVLISGTPAQETLAQIAHGMVVRGEPFQPAAVRVLEQSPSQTRLAMVLREGRKREIRRMWQAAGHRVLDLQRVRIDGLDLGNLPEGETRSLTADEIARLKGALS
jgi:23S rRNA pseudouridine2605 synthase